MAKSKTTSSNKGLVVLLCVLSLVIIGLGSGILAIFLTHNINVQEQYAEDNEYIAKDDKAIIIEETYNEAIKLLTSGKQDAYGEAIKCFDNAIASVDDPDVIFGLESARNDMLLEYGYYDEVIDFVSQMEEKASDVSKKINIYYYYKKAYEGIGNSGKVAEYDTLLKNALDELNKEMYEEQKEG